MMKKLTQLAVIIAAVTTQCAFAQEAATPAVTGTNQATCAKGHHGEKGKRLEHMVKDLGLTDQQKAQVEGIFKSQHPAMKAIRENPSLSKEQKREQIKPIMESTKQQISAILTPEQREKWEGMRKK